MPDKVFSSLHFLHLVSRERRIRIAAARCRGGALEDCMYRRLVIVAFALSLIVSAARANDILQITETGEGFNALSATFNGAPLNVLISGTPDAWTVQLPTGYRFANSLVGQGMFLVEPENALLFDQINIPQRVFLTWISDIPVSGATGTDSFTFANAGRGPGGKFDLVLSTSGRSQVPDSGSTLMLLAAGLACIAPLSRQWLKQNKRGIC